MLFKTRNTVMRLIDGTAVKYKHWWATCLGTRLQALFTFGTSPVSTALIPSIASGPNRPGPDNQTVSIHMMDSGHFTKTGEVVVFWGVNMTSESARFFAARVIAVCDYVEAFR